MDAGDTVLGPTQYTAHKYTPRPRRQVLQPPTTCGSSSTGVARGRRKHCVVLGFWSQKPGCWDLQALPGGCRACRCRHWALRTWGDSAPGRLAVMPSFRRQPALPPQAVFTPREEGTNVLHQEESAHYIIACFLFFKTL